MGILVLDERHSEDLRFLQDQPEEVLREFVKIALGFLQNGAQERLYAGAASEFFVCVPVQLPQVLRFTSVPPH
jgi:hypothetical protein